MDVYMGGFSMYTIIEVEQSQVDETMVAHSQRASKTNSGPFYQLDQASLRRRNAKVRQLLKAWVTDASEYEDKTWLPLKRSLSRNRSAAQRKLYHD
jgi:hypothetical protein